MIAPTCVKAAVNQMLLPRVIANLCQPARRRSPFCENFEKNRLSGGQPLRPDGNVRVEFFAA